ncbi:MAG: DUF2189 domain-containing protein [Rhizobiaceae bacterium]|nr:DUF2189 domain-containing protein [Rhizobiaceae bacterium]
MVEKNPPQTWRPPPMPVIRTVQASDIIASLKAGVSDFLNAPLFGIFFGAIYAVGGLLILAGLTILDSSWLIIPVAIAFPFIGPFIAVGLYEVSRRRAANIPLKWGEVLSVIAVQRERQFGLMAFAIMCIIWLWIFQIRLLLALFLGFQSFSSVQSFIQVITTTPEGLGFLVLGTAIGAILAFVLFATTVIAMPLLLDRDIDVISAIITSFKTVFKSPLVMIAWGIVVAALTILALLPAFLGLIIILPILGHATWHLFERAVEKL